MTLSASVDNHAERCASKLTKTLKVAEICITNLLLVVSDYTAVTCIMFVPDTGNNVVRYWLSLSIAPAFNIVF